MAVNHLGMEVLLEISPCLCRCLSLNSKKLCHVCPSVCHVLHVSLSLSSSLSLPLAPALSLSLSLSPPPPPLTHTHLTSEPYPSRTHSAEISPDNDQAESSRDIYEEDDDEDDDEELWEDVDEDRMTERELAFFSDERLAGSGTEDDSFLR